MNSLQWKTAFKSGLFSVQGLPFDKSLGKSNSSKYRTIDREVSLPKDVKSLAASSLTRLLMSYNPSDHTHLNISILNSNNELIPCLLSLQETLTLKGLTSLVNEQLLSINKSENLNSLELATEFNESLLQLSLPAIQCCFSQVKDINQVIEAGYFHFYILNKANRNSIGIKYDNSLFDDITAERLLDNWIYVLEQFQSGSDDNKVSELKTISPENSKTLINDWNETYIAPSKYEGFHQAFEDNVDKFPDRICASDESKTYSYLALENEANIIANNLIEHGIKTGDLISLALPRNVQLLSTIIAVFKSTAAYVPLDPDFPDDRLSYMAEHSRSKVLITTEQHKNRFNFFPGLVITIESILKDTTCNSLRPRLITEKQATAYVIYTSGSTGKPKGVEISQGNLLNLMQSMQKVPGINSDDTLCAVTTLSFDMSVVELFLPIFSGASIVIANKETSLYADKLIALLDKFRVTVLQATPATFRLLVSQEWAPKTKMKIICGGEPFPIDLAKDLQERVDSVWNGYGPTETTVFSTVHHVQEIQSSVLIGSPVDNTSTYILDDKLNPMPIGMPGNLYIGGIGLAKGYLHQENLTRERFITNPFKLNELIYETGDIARYTSKGELECFGRSDGQVKIRGYRIELGEVEACLSECKTITSQVVIAREDEPGNHQLVAYYLTENQEPLNEAELKSQLNITLPKYMVPNRFVHLKSFPMTLNFKIDRKALPIPSHINSVKINHQATTQTEKLLLDIWSNVLNLKNIDIKESFFDIGGNSLLSIRVFSAIKKQLLISLPLDTLFTHPTIEKLALHLDTRNTTTSTEESETTVSKNLVNIQIEGVGLPVFFFHGVGGNVLNYIRLVNSIGSERPTFGLQSSGVDGVSALESSYESMLDSYISEIRSVQPHGPYTLVGGSMGGVTALDIAIRLSNAGEAIDDVIMFDSYGPHLDVTISTKDDIKKDKESFGKRLINLLSYRFKMLKTRLAPPIFSMLNMSVPYSIRYQLIENNNYKLMEMRKPEKFHGNVTLIRAPMQTHGAYSDPSLGWKKTTSNLTTYYVEGNHTNMVESEHSMELFKQILLKDKSKQKVSA